MRQFIQTGLVMPTSQAVQIVRGGELYRLAILHVTIDAARTESRKRISSHPHSHDDAFHIVLYTQGDTDIHFGDRAVPARPGTLALSPPGDRHYFGPVAKGSISYAEVTFGLYDEEDRPLAIAFHELLSNYCGVELSPIAFLPQLDERQTAELYALLVRLLEIADSRTQIAEMQAHLKVGEIFAFLVRELFSAAEKSSAGEHTGLEEAKAHIETHYREKIAVPDLARIAHLSPGYFLRAFKRAYQISPIAYQCRLRVEAAYTLLRFSNLACKEIAQRLGYNDVYHFSKSFRKATGVSPTAFKRGSG